LVPCLAHSFAGGRGRGRSWGLDDAIVPAPADRGHALLRCGAALRAGRERAGSGQVRRCGRGCGGAGGWDSGQARAALTTIATAAASRTARTRRWWRGWWRRRWRRRRWSRGWRRAHWGRARVSPRQRSRWQCSLAEERRRRADTAHAPSRQPSSGGAASVRLLASGGRDLRAGRARNQGSATLPPALRRAALPSSAGGRPGRNPCRRTA
jgi:hypothetical protein